MNTSRYAKALLIISGLIISLVSAQISANDEIETKSAHPKMQHRLDRMIEKLELSDNQIDQFKAVMLEKAEIKANKRDQKQKIRQLIDNGFVDEAAETAATYEKQNIYAISEQKQRLAAILTEEQLATFESMKMNKRGKGKRCNKRKHKPLDQTDVE